MSVVLYNPTNETMRVTFAGRNFKLDPESKVKVDDACGKHILNEYSQRGLCSLDYGDESKILEIAKAGRETNTAFKIRQIENYNEQNEARKAIGLPFNPATKTLIEYARELSLVLSQPYKVDDTVARRSKELEAENIELKERLDYVQAQHNKLAEKMNKFLVDQENKKSIPEPENEIDKPAPKKRGPKPKVKNEE